HASGQFDHSEVRRDGPRPRDQPEARAPDGRRPADRGHATPGAQVRTVPSRVLPAAVTERPVLIVEDTASSRELLETLLRGWSIPPVPVSTAEEGLAVLERRNQH